MKARKMPVGAWAITCMFVACTSLAAFFLPKVTDFSLDFSSIPKIRGFIPQAISSSRVLDELATRILSRTAMRGATVVSVGKEQNVVAQFAVSQRQQLIAAESASKLPAGGARWVLLLYMHDSLEVPQALTFINQSTVTYIVVGYRAADSTVGIRMLLDMGYAVQMLSSTREIEGFGPNTLIDRAGLERLAPTVNALGASTFLFATQGFDLAIPSAREHIDEESGTVKTCRVGGLPTVSLTWVAGDVLLVECHGSWREEVGAGKDGASSSMVKDLWMSDSWASTAEAACVRASCGGEWQLTCTVRVLRIGQLNLASSMRGQSVTRPSTRLAPSITGGGSGGANILLLMIDAISRGHFERTMPLSKNLLKRLGYSYFQDYAAVGDNSGPNQAALYTGVPLSSRDIKSHAKSSRWLWDVLKSERSYVTLKTEDGCLKNSNMLQSIGPQTDHGHQLKDLFCRQYVRPNCLGQALSAEHLLNYTSLFLSEYSGSASPSRLPQGSMGWAAFVHLIDSHEDSMTMSAVLDPLLHDLIVKVHSMAGVDNTAVLIMSDHGLHYGPHFNTLEGRRERLEPLLYMKAPKQHPLYIPNTRRLVTPFDVHATLLEFAGVAGDLVSAQSSKGLSLTQPLPSNRRCSQAGIPSTCCNTAAARSARAMRREQHGSLCQIVALPPSVLSFYSDLPKDSRPLVNCGTAEHEMRLVLQGNDVQLIGSVAHADCECATDRMGWKQCLSSDSPLSSSNNNFLMRLDNDEEFVLARCGQLLDIVLRLNPRPGTIASSHKILLSGRRLRPTPRSIVVIEMEFVSAAFADRHLPLTMKLINELAGEEGKIEFSAYQFRRAMALGSFSSADRHTFFTGCLYDGNGTQAQHPCALSDTLFDVAKKNGYITWHGTESCPDRDSQSPYLASSVDHTLNNFNCRLEERIRQSSPYEGCLAGVLQFNHSLKQLQNFVEAYSASPIFAVVSTDAILNFGNTWKHIASAAQEADQILSAFLVKLMSKSTYNAPTIIIRGGKGDGEKYWPSNEDFSEKIEAKLPWNVVITPGPSLPSAANGQLLRLNSNRLVTSLDLHKTIQAIIAEHSADQHRGTSMTSRSDAIFDLTSQEVPLQRTCAAASVPVAFCACEQG